MCFEAEGGAVKSRREWGAWIGIETSSIGSSLGVPDGVVRMQNAIWELMVAVNDMVLRYREGELPFSTFAVGVVYDGPDSGSARLGVLTFVFRQSRARCWCCDGGCR